MTNAADVLASFDLRLVLQAWAVGIFSRMFNRSTKEKKKKCEAKEKYITMIG